MLSQTCLAQCMGVYLEEAVDIAPYVMRVKSRQFKAWWQIVINNQPGQHTTATVRHCMFPADIKTYRLHGDFSKVML